MGVSDNLSHTNVRYKRRRVALSCLECRRLKLKCDRVVPCSSCVRRGVGELCPGGQLQPGRNTKYVLEGTEQLHQRIEQLIERVHFLEDALASSKDGSTDLQREKPHPHLDAMLSAHRTESKSKAAGDDAVETLQEALGTLLIGDGGHVRWLGPTAFSESYLQPDAEQSAIVSSHDRGHVFPLSFRPPLEGMTKESLLECLPPFEEASSLVEAFIGHIGWLCQPFSRASFFRDTLKPAYGGDSRLISSDNLALLFIVLAIGINMDLTRPIFDPSARTYYLMCLTSLSLEDIFVHPSLSTIQTLHVISTYLSLSDDKDHPAVAPVFCSIGMRLAQSIGLHRDVARFATMNNEDLRDRRRLWWELAVGDAFLSMSLGRPTTTSYQHSDCLFPDDTQEDLGAHPLFQQGKFSFLRACVWPLLDQAMSTTPPSYAKILQMDATIRNWEHPGGRRFAAVIENEPLNSGFALARGLMKVVPESALLYLHRTYCSRALREHPEDPLKSRYAPSFVAAYRTAATILREVRRLYDEQPDLVVRLWVFGIHAISSAVVLGAIVSQAPGVKVAEAALSELEYACQFFESARSNVRIGRALPTLLKLKQKSYHAFAQYKSGFWIPPTRGPNSAHQDDVDAPGIITGTKIMSSRRTQSTPGVESSSKDGTPQLSGSESPESLHPRLEEDLQTILQSDSLDHPINLPAFQLNPVASVNLQFPAMDPSLYPPHVVWHSPESQLDDSAPITSTLSPANFVEGFAGTFIPVHDTSKSQTLNEEWMRFMTEI